MVATRVAVIVDGRYKNLVIDARTIIDQLTVVRIEAAPHNLSIIQAYAPISAALDEAIDEFYGVLEETLASVPRSDVVLVLGNFSTKVGKSNKSDDYHELIGSHGLRTKNQ